MPNEIPYEADERNYPLNSRLTCGLEISKKENWITENQDGSFSVPSQNHEETIYRVRVINNSWTCNCPDWKYHHEEGPDFECKHIIGTKFWIATNAYLKEEIAKPKVFSEDSIQCVKCGSIRIIKFGISDNKQIFKCKDCKKKFREPSILKKAHYSPETITLTLDLYFSGMSLRKIARTVSANFGEDLCYSTIYTWIQKFVPKISEYVNSLSPELSDTWHADELFVKMKGGIDYKTGSRKYEKIAFLWNVMDRKTRFLLSSKLSAYRDHIGANRAFDEARKNAHGNYPEIVTTDSLKSYGHIKYNTSTGWNVKHIENVGIRSKRLPSPNNNRIERMNGTLRERVKVQRGWKSPQSQIAEGQRIHYNFVKPHQALEGMTPAQRAGIGSDKSWLELLKKSLTPEIKQTSEKPED